MFSAYLALLRENRNFRLLWLAQIVSELGDWFYSLAVYSLLLELTGSKAQSVGLAVVLQVLPQTLAAPTAGVVNDRISRKRIMIGADLARFFIVLGMLLVRTPAMVWLVYPLLLSGNHRGGVLRAGAQSGVIPNIVAPERGDRGQHAGLDHLVVLPGGRRGAGRRGGRAGSGATRSSCSTRCRFWLRRH